MHLVFELVLRSQRICWFNRLGEPSQARHRPLGHSKLMMDPIGLMFWHVPAVPNKPTPYLILVIANSYQDSNNAILEFHLPISPDYPEYWPIMPKNEYKCNYN